MLDGKVGYLTVNNQGEVFPGWHGGPTESESFVPLIFGLPGTGFVDEYGTAINNPAALTTGYNQGLTATGVTTSGDYLRNWQLSPILNNADFSHKRAGLKKLSQRVHSRFDQEPL